MNSYGKEINAITSAKLILYYGTYNGSSFSLKVSKFSKSSLDANAQTAFSDLGDGFFNTAITTLSLSPTSYSSEITINISDLKNAYNNRTPFNLSFVLTANENSVGIVISPSSKLVITYDTTPPNPPTNVQANATTPGATSQAVLSWTHAAGGGLRTGYKVYNGGTLLKTESSTATGTTITGLTPNTPYTLCVKAYNDFGESTCANVTFTTPAIPTTISGSGVIYYSGMKYTLSNPPAGPITWGVSAGSPFTASPNTGNTTYLTKTANTGTGTLIAYVNGTQVATLSVSLMQPLITGPDTVYSGSTVYYQLLYEIGATYNWGSESGILTVVSSGSATGTLGGNTDRINCAVTLNGIITPVYNMYVTIQ